MTVRDFRVRFGRVEEPVLVGDGIWFPRASAELMAIAEGRVEADSQAHLRKPVTDRTHPETRTVNPLTKRAQAKGRMGR